MIQMRQFEDEPMFSPLQKELLNTLAKKGPMTRAEIVNELHKPRTTVYDNLTGLATHKLVKKYSRPTNARGRPLVFFKALEG
jgi:predicted ArsR family transcriptional regulator